MKTWFTIQAKANSAAEIIIYDEIGGFGISAKQFNDQLKALGDVRTINLRINSPGGSVFDGFAIFNMLKRHKARVEVVVDGLAASIASVIAMAGDKISMPENSMMMIHNPWGLVLGEADDMREMAEALDKMKVGILSAYRRSGKRDEEIAAIMDAETWYSAGEAVEAGFADEVIESVKVAAFFDLSKFQKPPEALQRLPVPDPKQNGRVSVAGFGREFQPPAPVADRPAPPRLTKDEAKILDRADAIIAADANAKLRAETLKTAGAIVKACSDAGHPELAAGFLDEGLTLEEVRAELATPDNVETAVAGYIKSELCEIVTLCQNAGVPELINEFVSKQRTIGWVRGRLEDVPRIRARCRAAHFPERANRYICAGMSLDEVSENLFQLKLAAEGPEINGHLVPEAMGYPGRNARGGGSKIDYTEIFSRYARGKND